MMKFSNALFHILSVPKTIILPSLNNSGSAKKRSKRKFSDTFDD